MVEGHSDPTRHAMCGSRRDRRGKKGRRELVPCCAAIPFRHPGPEPGSRFALSLSKGGDSWRVG